MSDASTPPAATGTGRSRKILLLLPFLLPAAGAGFWLGFGGLIPTLRPEILFPDGAEVSSVAYVPLEPVTVHLAPGGRSRHLRLTAQLEVPPAARKAVEHLRPRILDMMNSYLSAITLTELEAQSSMIRLRSHLLRRIQLIAGEDQIRDLLITEFVLN